MISVTDSSDGMSVHHYTDCDINSSNDIKQTRGVIREGKNEICKSFPFTPEFRSDDSGLDSYFEKYALENPDFRVFESLEGTLLRAWYRQSTNEWYLSTHRKINAFLSRWGSDLFYGEIFVNVLKDPSTVESYPSLQGITTFKEYSSRLNPDRIYLFLLRTSKENRIVCNTQTKNSIYTVGAFSREHNFAPEFGVNFEETIFESIPEVTFASSSPEKSDLKDGYTIDAIRSHVEKINPFHIQGLILIAKSGETIKVLNTEYEEMMKLRGSVPNVVLRYIQLRNQSKTEDAVRYQELFSDYKHEFVSFERVLQDLIVNIHKKYMIRYIHHKVAIVPPEQYKIMSELHQGYLTAKKVVTMDVIMDHLKTLSAGKLMYLYTKFQQREVDYGNGNFVSEEERKAIQVRP